ncbi:MAG: gliding motility-associated C-terminal domain-containing protein, partial [Flavobacteriales bacterium]
VNDRFYIPGLQVFPNASIQIFNRWGNLVYENDRYDLSDGWNPKAEGASSGVYHYILRLPELPVPLVLSDGNGGETPYIGEAPAVFEGALHVVD